MFSALLCSKKLLLKNNHSLQRLSRIFLSNKVIIKLVLFIIKNYIIYIKFKNVKKEEYVIQGAVIINLWFVNDIKLLTNFEKKAEKLVYREYLFALRLPVRLYI